MEQRSVCKNAVTAALGQLHHQEILIENLASRMRARRGDELLGSVEPYGFVPQGSEVTEIPSGPQPRSRIDIAQEVEHAGFVFDDQYAAIALVRGEASAS